MLKIFSVAHVGSSVDSGHTKFCVHHTTMHHVTSCKATYRRKVYACLAVTCHLHFWQNDRDLLRATAVTRGWNGYHSKKQWFWGWCLKATRIWFPWLLTASHQAKPHGTEHERTMRLPSKKLPFCVGCRGQRAASKGKVSLIVDHQQPDGKISPSLPASPIGETGSTARRKNLKHDRKCQQYIIIPMSFSFDDLLLAFHCGWRHVFVTASPLTEKQCRNATDLTFDKCTRPCGLRPISRQSEKQCRRITTHI